MSVSTSGEKPNCFAYSEYSGVTIVLPMNITAIIEPTAAVAALIRRPPRTEQT